MLTVRRCILLAFLAFAASSAAAQNVDVMDSHPKASAVIGEPSSSFYVRFNRPIDHIRSRLSIYQDGKLVERLEPRLQTEPNVLFARAPTLPAGDYTMHWAVRTIEGVKELEGSIPFRVVPPK